MKTWHRILIALALSVILVTLFGSAHGQEANVKSPALTLCSFNIQFLGQFKQRDNNALADIVKGYDVVVVQELVAPPYKGTFPDRTPFEPDAEAASFFDAMKKRGFQYVLSEEDTGSGDKIHLNSSATEWWVTFYKPEAVVVADDLPRGFLAEDRSNHDDYERVPYAFAFRSVDKTIDFVLISVHLQPDGSDASKQRRKHELASIKEWINLNAKKEKDFLILGDMNIEDKAELMDSCPDGYFSLNDECRRTNTLINAKQPNQGAKPYDHVMYSIWNTTREIDVTYDLEVIDLVKAMKPNWKAKEPYPGDPYVHDTFRQFYSDHSPVVFRMRCGGGDDD